MRGTSCRFVFRPRNTTEESALVEEHIQAIAERQRHGRRRRVGGRLPAARRARPGGARQVPQGRVALFALWAQGPEIRQRRRRPELAAPGLRVVSGPSLPPPSRAWNARRTVWWSHACRGPSRAAGSPTTSRRSARG